MNKKKVSVFWFRRDLRLEDNAGLYHALKSGEAVLPVFIFDPNILDKLEDKTDSRVTFIHDSLADLNRQLASYQSSLYVCNKTPEVAWKDLLDEFEIREVFANSDYEHYASERDEKIGSLLAKHQITFKLFKDQVIFEKDEVLKEDGQPYTVFSPYKRKWMEKLRPEFHLKSYPTEKYANNFLKAESKFPSLNTIGFQRSQIVFPGKEYRSIIKNYGKTRDFPALEGTSKISVHLRFGTVSIRKLATDAFAASDQTWLSELIWREFYAMILWHFPYTSGGSFKKEFDKIRWRNNEQEFEAWCNGRTGYPIVDAGMRQLNQSGWMHNRIRMITASFLCKHLLIDWRWGEAYFAKKLIDYDMASNVGGWQWTAGTGNDAAPYFRVFNPELQTKKFDPELNYIKQWVPEFSDPFKYPKPMVEHPFARDRALKAYQTALDK